MTALAAGKNVLELNSAFSQLIESFGSATLAASSVFYPGALCVYDPSDDTIKPGAPATGLIALGRYDGDEVVDTSDAGAPKTIRIRTGIFKFENSAASDDVANSDAGTDCYIVDDNTVMITASGKSVAGKVVKVESDGVYVAVNPFS